MIVAQMIHALNLKGFKMKDEPGVLRQITLMRTTKVDEPNANGRVYTREVLEEALKEFNSQCPVYGTIQDGRSILNELSPKEISHRTLKAWIDEDGNTCADIELLDTPAGKIVNTLMSAGGNFSVGLRAAGSLFLMEDNPSMFSVENAEIHSMDLIPGAKLPILGEPNLDKECNMFQRIDNLREMVKTQCSDGNWNYNSYMHGMANGLLLALATLEGAEPEYLNAPEQWLADKPEEES